MISLFRINHYFHRYVSIFDFDGMRFNYEILERKRIFDESFIFVIALRIIFFKSVVETTHSSKY